MARRAAGRDSYLSRDEIVTRALDLLDAAGDVSTRRLAAALGVTPTAIYYHFSEKREIVLAVVDRIWAEAADDLEQRLGDPVTSDRDPVEVLVTLADAVRDAFIRHADAALSVAMTTEPRPSVAPVLGPVGPVFERLGIPTGAVGRATEVFTSFVLGSVLVTASRRVAQRNEAGEANGAERGSSVTDAPDDDEAFDVAVRALLTGLPQLV